MAQNFVVLKFKGQICQMFKRKTKITPKTDQMTQE